MIKLLIGHRGVGKSTLLKRIQNYFPTDLIFDLDAEIEKATGLTIREIFVNRGEAHFREIELKTLKFLVGPSRTQAVWVALGAGFPLTNISFACEKIWIRRSTDCVPRIFLDRPRLDWQRSLQDEYLQRFKERDQVFRKLADWDYLMPEGQTELSPIERQIFSSEEISVERAVLTVLPSFIDRLDFLKKFIFSKYELRDDLLSEDEIIKILKFLPANKLVLSLRRPVAALEFIAKLEEQGFLSNDLEVDCDVELPVVSQATIISAHRRQTDESLGQMLSRLERLGQGRHLKFAGEIFDFTELEQIFLWQTQGASTRSILPRSESGRWSWFRCRQRARQKLNFVQLMGGSAPDQPSLFQWMSMDQVKGERFAGVLGDPVFHSWSPTYHYTYFQRQGLPFFAIEVASVEWDQALALLTTLGLCYAAVTSPLKTKIGMNNSMRLSAGSWRFENTDIMALQIVLKAYLQSSSIFVWGGGGTLDSIRSLIPQARFFSVRTGEEREPQVKALSEASPEVVIWAAAPGAGLPPDSWQPQQVIDLNYREDSRAKELAIRCRAQYISGEAMFRLQADAQQNFWGLNER